MLCWTFLLTISWYETHATDLGIWILRPEFAHKWAPHGHHWWTFNDNEQTCMYVYISHVTLTYGTLDGIWQHRDQNSLHTKHSGDCHLFVLLFSYTHALFWYKIILDTEIGKRQVKCETVYINRKYFKIFICCGLDVKRAINCILPKIMCFSNT